MTFVFCDSVPCILVSVLCVFVSVYGAGEANTGSVSLVGCSMINVAVDIADGAVFVTVVKETTAVVIVDSDLNPLRFAPAVVGLVKPLAIFWTLLTATSSWQP